ncbi:hypothetical protein HK099_000751 [Clydaea vesicula]|uniref:RhoGAP-domain-containing protein n=1 Tax=Clydaea vesicula TaxID=447962 RepID=A0AAD5Y1I2_9FUNG|nr:hypothetical protein HK099_000751 [Clydaea vesicula]
MSNNLSVFEPVSGLMLPQNTAETLLNNVILERNTLRQQNEQLWKIIEKQKILIMQLQDNTISSKETRKSTNGRERVTNSKMQHPPSTQDRYKTSIDQTLPQIAPSRSSSSNNSLQQKSSNSNTTQLPSVQSANQPNYLASQSYSGVNSGSTAESKNLSSPTLSETSNGHILPKLENHQSFNKLPRADHDTNKNRDSISKENDALNYSQSDPRRLSLSTKPPHHINDDLALGQKVTKDSVNDTTSIHMDEQLQFESNQLDSSDPQQFKISSDGIVNNFLTNLSLSTFPQNLSLPRGDSLISAVINPDSVFNLDNFKIIFLDVVNKTKKVGGKELSYLCFKICSNTEIENELWRCEKLYSDFFVFDMKVKSSHTQDILSKLQKIPEKSLFQPNTSPQKFAFRKQNMDSYLEKLKSTLPTDPEILNFFKTDVVENVIHSNSDSSTKISNLVESELNEAVKNNVAAVDINKEGYLTKKGKGFGGYTWKKKYFVLRKGLMECYETNDTSASSTGTIKLKYCTVDVKIGYESDPEYKYAFCITEYKKETFKHKANPPLQDAKVNCKYVLHCVDDLECESWIKSVQENINLVRPPILTEKTQNSTAERNMNQTDLQLNMEPGKLMKNEANNITIQTVTPPISPTQPISIRPASPSRNFVSSNLAQQQQPKFRNHIDETERIMKQATAPINSVFENSPFSLNGTMDPVKKDMENKDLLQKKKEEKNKNRMTNFFTGGKKKIEKVLNETSDSSKVVFGVSLEKCLQISKINENFELPSIVYRCIEYLDAKDEGDVDLVNSGVFYDVHAVAGLLKLWFRELTSPVLSTEKQKDFLQLTEISDRNQKIQLLKKLCSQLPRSNYTLIRSLIGHLIKVVQSSAVNKMTVRNVGIVFAPTLSVPAGVFTLMMAEYDTIFCWDGLNDSEVERNAFSSVPLEIKVDIGLQHSSISNNPKSDFVNDKTEPVTEDGDGFSNEEVKIKKRIQKQGAIRIRSEASQSMVYENDNGDIVSGSSYESDTHKFPEESLHLKPHEPLTEYAEGNESRRPKSGKKLHLQQPSQPTENGENLVMDDDHSSLNRNFVNSIEGSNSAGSPADNSEESNNSEDEVVVIED